MSNNTRARSAELAALAAEIAASACLDRPAADNRPYIIELAERGHCHIETARRVWRRHFQPSANTWGGNRRKKG